MANTYEQNTFKNMAEAVTFQEQEGTTSTVTVVETDEQDVPRVTLKLRKPRTDRKVQWSTETVDNENMNKKKSKCCCIYDKPRRFDESSSDESDNDECDHCHGHVERKKQSKEPIDSPDEGGSATARINSTQTVTIDN